MYARAPRHLRPPSPGDFVQGCGESVGDRRRDGAAPGRRKGRVSPAASALAKLWKGELVPPLSSSAATDCCPIVLVRLLVGDSKTSMRLGEHDGSIGDDISASNPRSRGRFWHASIVQARSPLLQLPGVRLSSRTKIYNNLGVNTGRNKRQIISLPIRSPEDLRRWPPLACNTFKCV